MPNQPLNKFNYLCDLSHLGLIKIIGEQAKVFLQGQLTCNLEEVTDNQHRLAAYCNHQGRVLATLRLFLWHGNYYFLMPVNNIEPTLQQLKKFAAFSKVTFENVSDEINYFGLAGDDVENVLKNYFPSIPTIIDSNQEKDNTIVLRILGKEPRFIFFHMSPLTKKISALIKEISTHPSFISEISSSSLAFIKGGKGESHLWRLLDIRAGIPNIYPETSGLFTPHMINYPTLNGVSFNKGCYVGQEIVARTEHLGKAKRHMHYLTFKIESSIYPGNQLKSKLNKEAGIIIDTYQMNGMYELLAVIQDGMLAEIAAAT